jgi:hypothetical protein
MLRRIELIHQVLPLAALRLRGSLAGRLGEDEGVIDPEIVGGDFGEDAVIVSFVDINALSALGRPRGKDRWRLQSCGSHLRYWPGRAGSRVGHKTLHV